jgi:hypothetical protein
LRFAESERAFDFLMGFAICFCSLLMLRNHPLRLRRDLFFECPNLDPPRQASSNHPLLPGLGLSCPQQREPGEHLVGDAQHRLDRGLHAPLIDFIEEGFDLQGAGHHLSTDEVDELGVAQPATALLKRLTAGLLLVHADSCGSFDADITTASPRRAFRQSGILDMLLRP